MKTTENRLINVLIIDDEPKSLLWLKDELEEEDFNVNLVGNGIEALEIIKRFPFDIVFLDLVMSGQNMDGVDIFDKIKELNVSLPIVLITGYSLDKRISILERKGIASIIEKPLEIEDILLAIENHCQRN